MALAVGCLLAGGGLITLTTVLPKAVGGVLLATGMLLMTTRFSRRSPALLRLDWFMRALRRQGATNWVRRTAARLLPSWLFSDRSKKKRGGIRRGFRWLGLSWSASPIRRLVQAACLALFLLFFLYVCWPYAAAPAPPVATAPGWQLRQIEDSGDVVFANAVCVAWIEQQASGAKNANKTATIYLRPESTDATGIREPAYPWNLVSVTRRDSAASDAAPCQIRLQPAEEAPVDAFETLLRHSGGWELFERDPAAWPTHHADNLQRRERVPAEVFLLMDPLVSISTAIASRSWVWSLTGAGAILIVCVLVPRGFCGYLCPLGTTIDLFDWAVAGRVKKFRVPDGGWWVHAKYYLLAGILISATMGVLLSGIFAAIPIVTRAALFCLEPIQSGALRGWHLAPPMHVGHVVSIGLFFGVLGLGFLRPRFWCKYVCPSGAVFSLGNLFRATERKVESSCIHCNKCIEICPFDAIKLDFTTRATDCTMCQSCAGVCPTEAIKFVDRWNDHDLKVENDPPTNETSIGRRGFLSLAAGGAAAVAGGIGSAATVKTFGADGTDPLVRPPGSVPEREFLEMCIRCGECFKVCPNNVLQAEGFQQGLEGLWAPMVVADWAGCESSCNNCGQVCPTGAIRALPMEEKRVARMGLAIVNEQTCLPMANKEACDLCVQECNAAGYHAIEYQQVHTQVDEQGQPVEGTGFLAPVVLADACVGCGLCQTRCYAINVKERHVLEQSAIIVEAGEGKEDRIMTGSYIALREQRQLPSNPSTSSSDLPRPKPKPSEPSEPSERNPLESDNPFGTGGF